jgi:trehalose 6-phosphate phosphatase
MVEGEVLAAVEFAPRPDFGHVPVRLEGIDNGLRAVGTLLVLRSPRVDWRIADGTAAVVAPPFTLELQLGAPSEVDSDWPPAGLPPPGSDPVCAVFVRPT